MRERESEATEEAHNKRTTFHSTLVFWYDCELSCLVCCCSFVFIFFEKLPVDRKTQSERERAAWWAAQSRHRRALLFQKDKKKSFNFSSPFIARRLSVFSYWIVCDEAQQESDNHDKTILCFLHSLVLNTISLNHFMEEVDEVCEFVSLCILCFCFAFFFILIAASLCLSIQACWIPQQSPSLWCCSRRFNAKVRAGPATITNSPAIWNGRVFTIGRIASMFVHVLSSSLLFFFAATARELCWKSFPFDDDTTMLLMMTRKEMELETTSTNDSMKRANRGTHKKHIEQRRETSEAQTNKFKLETLLKWKHTQSTTTTSKEMKW